MGSVMSICDIFSCCIGRDKSDIVEVNKHINNINYDELDTPIRYYMMKHSNI